MIAYPDGTGAQIGDSVLLNHGEVRGVIHDVIESGECKNKWGVNEYGLMIESPYYGMVFCPVRALIDDEIVFVSRRTD